MNPKLSAVAVLAAIASTPAQNCFFYPSDTPATGAPDPRPFGAQDPLDPVYGFMLYQVQIPQAVLGNQPLDICEVFVAPAGSRTRTFTEFTVRFGHNPNPLTTQMSTNMVGFTSITVGTNATSFDTVADQWMPIGMGAPVRYRPANGMLVVEFFVRQGGAQVGTGDVGFRTDPSIPFVWNSGPGYNGTLVAGGGIKLRFCTDHHGFIEYGAGSCVSSQGQSPQLSYSGSAQIGNSLQVNLANAPVLPNPTLSVLVFSFRVRSGPFDLAGLGSPGCSAVVFGDQASWLATSTGALSVNIPLPVGLTPCFPVWNQWFLFDPAANGLGLITSNYGRIMIGN